MIFKQIDEILSGKKTQTRRIRKWSESLTFMGDVRHGDRMKWKLWRTYAIVPKRGQFAIGSHRIKITGIRLEFLQSITEQDAIREGVDSVAEYRELWEEINGKSSWDKNTVVWVIDFECVAVSDG